VERRGTDRDTEHVAGREEWTLLQGVLETWRITAKIEAKRYPLPFGRNPDQEFGRITESDEI
jgi:hypothetical protein